MKINEQIEITNEDNMLLMARYPDNYFDLAIVDPPYGIGISNNPVRGQHEKKNWDDNIPNDLYFKELFRVSKNQIIWGGNYFNLPPTQCFFIWDKKQPEKFSLAMCEFAWCSIQKPAKMWSLSVLKENNQPKSENKNQIVELAFRNKQLIKGILENDYKILDTHLGSGSIAIAIDKINKKESMNISLTACELDYDYYFNAIKRIKNEISNQYLF